MRANRLRGISILVAMILGSAATGYGESQPQAEEDCPMYESRIHALSEVIADSVTTNRYQMGRKYVEFIHAIEELDRYTRFRLDADEDGQATLKLNTPEEELRDSILGLLGWVDWFDGQADELAEPLETDRVLVQMKSVLGDIQGYADKYKTSGLTLEGRFEDVVAEYVRLKEARRVAMENLVNLADRYLCHGLIPEEMELAELYHYTIPDDRRCNDLQKKALLDRVRQVPTLGFGSIFEPATYDKLKLECSFGTATDAAVSTPAGASEGETGAAEYVAWLDPEQLTCCPADTNGEPNYAFQGTTADGVKPSGIVLARFSSRQAMEDWACNRRIVPHYWARTYAKIDGYNVTSLPCPINPGRGPEPAAGGGDRDAGFLPGFLGCFKDAGSPSSTQGRDLKGAMVSDREMTVTKCLEICRSAPDGPFPYAAVQYGVACFCGSNYGSFGRAENCDMSCPGDGSQNCGGSWANAVYSTRPPS